MKQEVLCVVVRRCMEAESIIIVGAGVVGKGLNGILKHKGKMVKEPMEMTLSKNGFVIEQNGEKQEILWEQVGSVEHMKGQLIIYMSRIRAYLIPDRAIGDQKEAFFVLLREVIPKERRKRV